MEALLRFGRPLLRFLLFGCRCAIIVRARVFLISRPAVGAGQFAITLLQQGQFLSFEIAQWTWIDHEADLLLPAVTFRARNDDASALLWRWTLGRHDRWRQQTRDGQRSNSRLVMRLDLICALAVCADVSEYGQ